MSARCEGESVVHRWIKLLDERTLKDLVEAFDHLNNDQQLTASQEILYKDLQTALAKKLKDDLAKDQIMIGICNRCDVGPCTKNPRTCAKYPT
jgi:hypothetical protein